MIQLTRKGVCFTGTQQDLDMLRATFDRENYVILPQLYEPSLLEEILQRVHAARFFSRDHDGIALELCMADQLTLSLLTFLHSVPSFLRIIEYITGQPGIGAFTGRVYQMNSSDGHYDKWHDDFIPSRAATMSVNLSRQVFEGGALQLKLYESKEILHEVHNTGLGDALLFRISKDLIHRVQSVTGEHPKVAFAGWFIRGEDFLPILNKQTAPSLQNVAGAANDRPIWEGQDSPRHD